MESAAQQYVQAALVGGELSWGELTTPSTIHQREFLARDAV